MQSFSPFRIVGNICSDIPAAFTLMYEQPVVMVAVGRTYQIYRGKELTLLRGGPLFERNIKSVAMTGKYRFVAEGSQIHAFSHHKPLWTVFHSDTTKSKPILLLARDDYVFSVGEDRKVVVWLVKTGEKISEFLVEQNQNITRIDIPSAYTNKLIATTAEGTVHLYNFRTGKCLFVSQTFGAKILSLAVSQYKDLIAFGCANGQIVVYNFATDARVAEFNHESSAVTSICFRLDRDASLCTGTVEGEIAIWDLKKRCLDGVITKTKQVRSRADVLDSVHNAAVHSLFSLPETSMLVSAGADNAIIQFRFDTVDGLGLLTRERRGHVGSCTHAAFYNTDLIITGGADQAMRCTHIFSDRATWELSQGKLGKRGRDKQLSREAMKLPAATKIASCTMRNYQFSSIVSIHESSAQLVGWRMDTRAQEMKAAAVSTSLHTARCVALSMCGSYAVVGYSSGNLASINLQDQKILHFFTNSKTATPAHEGSVEVVEIGCGNTVVASSGLDGLYKLWDLFTGKLLKVVDLGTTLGKSCVHMESSMVIASCDDNAIRAYSCDPDSASNKPLRTFTGHGSSVTALALTPDTHRHIVSASTDCIMMLWDIAAACCVGQYRTITPTTSINFHPDGQFLLTTHAGERGAFLWTNNLRYGYAPDNRKPLPASDKSIPMLHYPQTATAEASDELEDDLINTDESLTGVVSVKRDDKNKKSNRKGLNDVDEDGEEEDVVLFDEDSDVGRYRREQIAAQKERLEQIRCGGLQLSGVPRSTWLSLTMLDHIKAKNQPLLPPKKRDVPFFLQQTQEIRPTFIVEAQTSDKIEDESKIRTPFETDVASLAVLHRALIEEQFDDVMSAFLGMSAHAIDAEVRSFVQYDPDVEYTADEKRLTEKSLIALIRFLTHFLKTRQNVDFCQSLLHLVMKHYGETILRFPKAAAELKALTNAQMQVQAEIQQLHAYPSTLVSTFTNAFA